MIIQQSLKNLVNMVLVCSKVRRVYQNVIQIDIHEVMQKVSQNVIDHGLENSRCIGETEWHHLIFVVTVGCVKASFPFISLFNSNQVISIAEV